MDLETVTTSHSFATLPVVGQKKIKYLRPKIPGNRNTKMLPSTSLVHADMSMSI